MMPDKKDQWQNCALGDKLMKVALGLNRLDSFLIICAHTGAKIDKQGLREDLNHLRVQMKEAFDFIEELP